MMCFHCVCIQLSDTTAAVVRQSQWTFRIQYLTVFSSLWMSFQEYVCWNGRIPLNSGRLSGFCPKMYLSTRNPTITMLWSRLSSLKYTQRVRTSTVFSNFHTLYISASSSFVIFWHPGTLSVRVSRFQKLQMTASPLLAQDAFSCTHMATVGVKGLSSYLFVTLSLIEY